MGADTLRVNVLSFFLFFLLFGFYILRILLQWRLRTRNCTSFFLNAYSMCSCRRRCCFFLCQVRMHMCEDCRFARKRVPSVHKTFSIPWQKKASFIHIRIVFIFFYAPWPFKACRIMVLHNIQSLMAFSSVSLFDKSPAPFFCQPLTYARLLGDQLFCPRKCRTRNFQIPSFSLCFQERLAVSCWLWG